MSLILDALNRSRQDADRVPGIGTRHFEGPEDGSARNWLRWLPWVGLVIALVVITWLLLRGEGGPTERPTAAATSPAGEAAVAAAPPAAGGSEPGPGAQTGPGPEPAQLPKAPPPAPAPIIEREATAPPAAQPAPPPQPVAEPGPQARPAPADPAVAALYQSREAEAPETPPPASEPAPAKPPIPAPAPGRVEEQQVDIEQLVAQAKEEMDNARLAEHPAPFLVDLSQQTKDSIPTIFYQRHNYRGDSASSTVVLNGEELRVGGRPAPGMKVDEILPDSVVLSYQGTQFRLRALNSWVNL